MASDKVRRECAAMIDDLHRRFNISGRSELRVRSTPDALADFAFLSSASTIVLTFQGVQASSFGWWAAFLSRSAHTVHMPLNLCTYPWWSAKFTAGVTASPAGGDGGAPEAAVLNPSARESESVSRAGLDAVLHPFSATQPTAVFDDQRYVFHDLVSRKYFGRAVGATGGIRWPPAPHNQ